ncbi:hypothetical protein B4U80_11804, partial [Leptotrombidium deliense]
MGINTTDEFKMKFCLIFLVLFFSCANAKEVQRRFGCGIGFQCTYPSVPGYQVEYVDLRCVSMPKVIRCRAKAKDSYYFDTIQEECKKLPANKCINANPFNYFYFVDFQTMEECQKVCKPSNNSQKPNEQPTEKPVEQTTEQMTVKIEVDLNRRPMHLTFVLIIAALVAFNCVFVESKAPDARCTTQSEIVDCLFRILPSYYFNTAQRKCLKVASGKCVQQSLIQGLFKPKDFLFLSDCQRKCETGAETTQSVPSETEAQTELESNEAESTMSTVQPEITNEPEGTSEGDITTEKEVTTEQEVTTEPEITAEAEISEEPEISTNQEISSETDVTNEPEATAEQEVTREEEITTELDTTIHTEVSSEPEKTNEPEMTSEPEISTQQEINTNANVNSEPGNT